MSEFATQLTFLLGVLVGMLVLAIGYGIVLVFNHLTGEIYTDTERLDFLKTHALSLHSTDGKFAVVGGMPFRMITPIFDEPRDAIDYVLSVPETLDDESIGLHDPSTT